MALLRAKDDDDSNNNFAPRLTLRYFNFYPNITQALKPGAPARVLAKFAMAVTAWKWVHPVFKRRKMLPKAAPATRATAAKSPPARRLTPIYRLRRRPGATCATLANKALRVTGLAARPAAA